jgi:hypothetical protein
MPQLSSLNKCVVFLLSILDHVQEIFEFLNQLNNYKLFIQIFFLNSGFSIDSIVFQVFFLFFFYPVNVRINFYIS